MSLAELWLLCRAQRGGAKERACKLAQQPVKLRAQPLSLVLNCASTGDWFDLVIFPPFDLIFNTGVLQLDF